MAAWACAARCIDVQNSAGILGEFVALRGRSGSGKTTLLNILIGLDNPTQGQVLILNKDLAAFNETERARLRRRSIGMMFQNAHLFSSLTAQENVEIPLRLALAEADQREKLAYDALKRVGLAPRAHHRRVLSDTSPTSSRLSSCNLDILLQGFATLDDIKERWCIGRNIVIILELLIKLLLQVPDKVLNWARLRTCDAVEGSTAPSRSTTMTANVIARLTRRRTTGETS